MALKEKQIKQLEKSIKILHKEVLEIGEQIVKKYDSELVDKRNRLSVDLKNLQNKYANRHSKMSFHIENHVIFK